MHPIWSTQIHKTITNISNLIDKNAVIAVTSILHLQQWTDHLGRKSIKKQWSWMIHWTRWTWHIFRTFHPKAAEYTFFLSALGTFSKIDHILGHKKALNKYKRIEIIPRTLSDHNAMKLEINHRKSLENLQMHGG